MFSALRPAIVILSALTLLTGLAYPLAVQGLGQGLFAQQAQGSLIVEDGKLRGSHLIGQSFSDPGHFWGRPSATSPMADNAANSSGSNLGPLNPALLDAVKGRVQALRAADPDNKQPVPVDLVTASASGLDPEISLAAARYQAARVARVRKLDVSRVMALIGAHTRHRAFGFFGEERVNVLDLNLALEHERA